MALILLFIQVQNEKRKIEAELVEVKKEREEHLQERKTLAAELTSLK